MALAGAGVWLARDRLLWPAPKPTFAAPVGPWLPFTQGDAPLITVPVGVGGTTITALVDSGAQYTSIDRDLVEHLGLNHGLSIPMVALGVGGVGQVARGVTIDLDLGGARITGLRVASLDLSQVSRALGQAIPLIIGFDVLSVMAVEIDFPGRRMRLGEPTTFPVEPGGVAAPVRRAGRALVAQVRVNDTALEALVDTGATGFIGISEAAARQAGLGKTSGLQGQSVVLGGVAASRVIAGQRLSFAGQAFSDVDVHIIELPNVPGFPKGLLGVETLRDKRVVIDAGAGRMRLYPM